MRNDNEAIMKSMRFLTFEKKEKKDFNTENVKSEQMSIDRDNKREKVITRLSD